MHSIVNRCSAASRGYRLLLTLLLMLSVTLSGCSFVKTFPGGGQQAVTETGPTLSEKARVDYHILAGEVALQRGRNKYAAHQYLDALRLKPSPELAKRTVIIAQHARDRGVEREATERWVTIEPKNLDAWEASAQAELASGDRAAARHAAEKVVKLDPEGIGSGMHQIALLFSGQTKQADNALSIMDALVRAHSDLATAHYAKGLLAIRYGRLQTARESAEKALSLKPGLLQASLLKAGVEIQSGDFERASHIMDRVLSRSPHDLTLHNAYARLLLNAGQDERAVQQFRQVLALDSKNPDALYASGLLALKADAPGKARRYFSRLLRTGHHTNQAAYYLGRIDEKQGHYNRALRWYKKVEGGPQALDAVLRRGRLQARSGHLQQAVHFLAAIRERNPQLARRLYREEGQLLYGTGHYRQATRLYQRALQAYPRDHNLRYEHAISLEKIGKHERARHELRLLIQQDPTNARALNALGYFLTNHTDAYGKARGYIRRALKLMPSDPAVNDSMGWVEHHLGENKKALDYLRQAYHQTPDPAVASHLGTVLWALGRHEQARRIWEKALDNHPQDKTLKSTLQMHNL